MKRESAVSETISYDTGRCSICEKEVALDRSAPDEIIESKAYVAILGEGELSKDVEEEGNWDFELAFKLDEEDQRHPNVSGFIICEECARTIHGHPDDAEYYNGDIPSEIKNESLFDETTTETSQLAVILAVILLAMVLILIFSI